MTTTPIVSARDIRKTFREGNQETVILRGCSLDVSAGEIVSLEGPSGSGKTTLLSIIGCILTPTSGELRIAGARVPTADPSALPAFRRTQIGFVFQQYNLFPSLSTFENVAYALQVKGHAAPAAEAHRVLDAVGLTDRKKFLPRDLSGGQKQRVAIARALAGGPPLLLADEPTANLDATSATQVLALFRDLAKRENRALIIVTHDHKVRTIADRVIEIHDGALGSDTHTNESHSTGSLAA